jgi:type II secretory pathway component PulF
MHTYYFKLLTPDGALEKGLAKLPFLDSGQVHHYLENESSIVISLQRVPTPLTIPARIALGIKKIKRSEISQLFYNLHILLRSGLTLKQALKEGSSSVKNPLLRQSVFFLKSDLVSGLSFHQALQRQHEIYPPSIVHLTQVGQETGQMEKMCRLISDHLHNLDRIMSKTKRSLIYPAFSLCIVLFSIVFWFWFVVPKIISLFEDIGAELPALTQWLLAISNLIQDHGTTILLVILGLAFLITVLRKKSAVCSMAFDHVTLNTPVFGKILETSISARVTEYLQILLESDIHISRSMSIIIRTVPNAVIKKRMLSALEFINHGNSLSVSLKKAKALDPFALRMLAIGDGSSRIQEQARFIASYYQERMDHYVELLSKVLEPILMLLLGVLFAVVIWGLLVPIYDLVTQI